MTVASDFIPSLYADFDPAKACYQDAAGTILAADGDPIGYAANQAGGDPITQSNTSAKMLLTTDTWGHRCWYSDGVDDYLRNGTFLPGDGSPGWEMTLVVEPVTNNVVMGDGTFGRVTVVAFLGDAYQVTWGAAGDTGLSTTGRDIVQITVDGPTSQAWVNGVAGTTYDPGSNNWTDGIAIGCRGSVSSFIEAKFTRVLVHGVLTPTQRADLYAYLDDYYNNFPRAYDYPLSDPTDIPGLVHRWRPHDGCQSDAAGTTEAAVADPIGKLPDTIGTDALQQSDTSKKPTLKQDANGWRYAEFDGVDDFINNLFAAVVPAPYTLAVIANIPATVAETQFLTDGANTVARGILWLTTSDQIGIWSTGGPGNFLPFTPGDLLSDIAVFDSSDPINRINGTEASGGSIGGTVTGLGGLTLSASYSGTTRILRSDIYDVLIFSRALDLTERRDLEANLLTLYGTDITPPASGLPLSFIHHHLQMMGAR